MSEAPYRLKFDTGNPESMPGTGEPQTQAPLSHSDVINICLLWMPR